LDILFRRSALGRGAHPQAVRDSVETASRLATAGRWLLAASVAGAALAAGAVHTATLCVVCLALAVAVGLIWWGVGSDELRPRKAATILVITATLLTAYTALQALPVPIGWLGVLAPRNAMVWSDVLAPLHAAAPALVPLSLDPSATKVNVLKGVVYLLALLGAIRVARTRSGVGFLTLVIVVTAAAVAVAALLHPAFGARKLYGVWAPSATVLIHDRHIAPFLNPNNLASYLNVGFCLALAVAVAPDPRWPRPLAIAATILFGGTQVWVASRGGVAAMTVGALLVLFMMRRLYASPEKRSRHLEITSSLVVLAILCAGAAVVLSTSKEASDDLFDTDVSKLVLLRQAFRMVPAFPIFGVGRGAFESTFNAFRTIPGPFTFTHPENVVAQWTVEWGVPLALAGLMAIGFALRPRTALLRSTSGVGAWAALMAVAGQSLVDLGSETPGLVLAPVLCAAIVVGGTAGSKTRHWTEGWSGYPRGLVLAAGAAALLGVALALPTIGGEVDADRAALYAATSQGDIDVRSVHELAEGAMLRHPAEPYLPMMVAARAAQKRDDEPMPWIEATLARGPTNAMAHLLLAHILTNRSQSQARLEYRLAFNQGIRVEGPWSSELPRLVHNYDDAVELVANGPAGPYTIDLLMQALSPRLPATSMRLRQDLARRLPTDSEAPFLAAKDALVDLADGDGAPWCAGEARRGCVKRAVEEAALAQQFDTRDCEPAITGARIRIADGDPTTGLTELALAADASRDPAYCLQGLEALAVSVHDEARASDAIAKLTSLACSDDAECSSTLIWAASAEEKLGKPRQALILFKRAYDRSPGRDDLLEDMARLAAATDLHAESERAYERLAQKHPDDTRWARAAEAQHDAVFRAAAASMKPPPEP
jgi:hypothetical protein